MKFCKACGEACLFPLHLPPEKGGPWWRCLSCGSDSSAERYDPSHYSADYLAAEVAATGGPEARVKELEANLNWFLHCRNGWPDNHFLDVGCAEGSMLEVMAGQGCSVHGFDVIEAARTGDHVTIAPFFSAHLLRRRFGLVMCREVIEHVDGWRQLLFELARATVKGGFLQLQTPRPAKPGSVPVHIPYHLQILDPVVIWEEARKWGFRVVGNKFWHTGQVWLFRHDDDGPV